MWGGQSRSVGLRRRTRARPFRVDHELAYINTCMYVPIMSSSATRPARERQRPRQAERSARSRGALLESAARGLSRYGYGNLRLEEVAREAGYTRGALYHQFKDKEDLALAVIDWVAENWLREVGDPAREEPDAVAELLALARGPAIFCRRDSARGWRAPRVELAGQAHPVGREIDTVTGGAIERV